MKTLAEKTKMIKAAENFLKIEEMLHEKVSRYFACSNDEEDIEAYYKVTELDHIFVDAYNQYWGENDLQYGLNYEAAEFVLA